MDLSLILFPPIMRTPSHRHATPVLVEEAFGVPSLLAQLCPDLGLSHCPLGLILFKQTFRGTDGGKRKGWAELALSIAAPCGRLLHLM